MNKPLTEEKLLSLLNGRTKVIEYKDLYRYHNIHDLLRPYGNIILLIVSNRDGDNAEGHWVGIMYTPEGIEYFDPYGLKPDESLLELRDIVEDTPPYLTQLLVASGENIVYNHYPFQQPSSDIATCGRHVVGRIRNMNTTLDEYLDLFKGFDPDVLITEAIK